MGYRYIVVEGRGGYDPQEPIESWELKGTKSNGVGESLVMSDDKMHKFNKPYPIVNTTKDIAGSEVKFWRNLVDTLLNKGVLLSESGNNKLYFVVPAHGFGNIGRILYHLCNRQDTESVTVCYDYYTVMEASGYLDEVLAYFTEVYRQSDIQLHIIEGYTFERALISCGVLLRFNRADEYYKTGTGADLWELHMQALLLQPKVLNYSERITDFVPPTLMALAPNADSFEQLYAGILKHLLPEGSCFSVSKGKLGPCWLCDCPKMKGEDRAALWLSTCKILRDSKSSVQANDKTMTESSHKYKQGTGDILVADILRAIPSNEECGFIQNKVCTRGFEGKALSLSDYYKRVLPMPKYPSLEQKFKLLVYCSSLLSDIIRQLGYNIEVNEVYQLPTHNKGDKL